MANPKHYSSKSDEGTNPSSNIPEEAFLILEAIKVIHLIQTITNNGRRDENDIVIDDTRVSRYHAQLRAANGRYELIDMNSSGGTYINGMRISKNVLYPGDAISLAGFGMVYKQHDAPPRTDLRETAPCQSDDLHRYFADISPFPSRL